MPPTPSAAFVRLASTFALTALLLVVGCGDGQRAQTNEGDASVVDAGRTFTRPTPAEWATACSEYVALYCSATLQCFNFYASQVWGEGPGAKTACETYYLPWCAALDGAPGISDEVMQSFLGVTADWKSAAASDPYLLCLPAFDLYDAFAWSVRSAPGTLATGAPCFDTSQCGAGLYCSNATGCGTCVPTKADGDACSDSSECRRPTDIGESRPVCVGGKCTVGAHEGEICALQTDCDRLLACIGGVCQRTQLRGQYCGRSAPCDAMWNALSCVDGTCVPGGTYPATEGAPCDYSLGFPVCGAMFQCVERGPSVAGFAGVTTSAGSTTTSAGVTGTVVDGGTCNSLVADSAGKVVLCLRGGTTFAEKMSNAPGALAILFLNNDDPMPDSIDTGNDPTIPVMIVTKADGMALLALVGTQVTVYGRESGACRAPVGEGQPCGDGLANCVADGRGLTCNAGSCQPSPKTCP